MKRFNDYYCFRENEMGNAPPESLEGGIKAPGANPDEDASGGSVKSTLSKLAEAAWDFNKSKVLSFYENLATTMGAEETEIPELLEKLRQEDEQGVEMKSRNPDKKSPFKDDDIIVPPGSDGGGQGGNEITGAP